MSTMNDGMPTRRNPVPMKVEFVEICWMVKSSPAVPSSGLFFKLLWQFYEIHLRFTSHATNYWCAKSFAASDHRVVMDVYQNPTNQEQNLATRMLYGWAVTAVTSQIFTLGIIATAAQRCSKWSIHCWNHDTEVQLLAHTMHHLPEETSWNHLGRHSTGF